ncbi:MAG: hypothetical protein KC619_23620 [Myxococcales bacterium]|nr:hypothetical protein [Myxococcales bacterium]
MRHAWIGILVVALGCGGGTASDDEATTSGDEATEPVDDDGMIDPTVEEAALEGAENELPRLVLLPMDDIDQAEDGEGHLVGATQAVAFELDARLVPQRSEDQDPLRLHVGDLVLHRMQLARPGIFRFILADRSRVPEGAAVSIQYGDDDSTRVVVDPVLRIPWN